MEVVVVLGIEGYEPHWEHRAGVLASTQRARFSRLIGRDLVGAWLLWDLGADRWFAGGPVILGFGDTNVEVTHRKFDECAITWGQIDMTAPVEWAGLDLDWREYAHPALRRVRDRRLRAVNVIERIMSASWRPQILHAVEFVFDGARLAIQNALDENNLSAADEVGLAIGFWRRIPMS